MAGGLVLMGVLAAILPVSQAMVIHGIIQLVANGWRAFLLRDHLHWRFLFHAMMGAGLAFIVFFFLLNWQPDKKLVYLFLGLIPLMVWLPKHWFNFDVEKAPQAALAGAMVSGLNVVAGIAGQVLEIFFVRANWDRKAIVANGSIVSAMAHIVKIGVWAGPALFIAQDHPLPPVWLMAVAIPISMLGTWLGGKVLHRLSDINFRAMLKWILTGLGMIMLIRAATLW